MGITLPVPGPDGPASSWAMIDWLEKSYSSVKTTPAGASGGVVSIVLPDLEPDELWLIDRAVAYCTSSTDTAMRLYRGDGTPANLRSGTGSGNFDEADYPSGLLVRPQSGLTAVWTGASDGATATLTLQVRQYRQRTG